MGNISTGSVKLWVLKGQNTRQVNRALTASQVILIYAKTNKHVLFHDILNQTSSRSLTGIVTCFNMFFLSY